MWVENNLRALTFSRLCVCVCVFLRVWAIKSRWPEQSGVWTLPFPSSISRFSSSLHPFICLALSDHNRQYLPPTIWLAPSFFPLLSCPCPLLSQLQRTERAAQASHPDLPHSPSAAAQRNSPLFHPRHSLPPQFFLFFFLWGVCLRDLICSAFIMNQTVKIHLQNGTHFNTYMYQVGALCDV